MQHYYWRECFGYRRATGEKTQASQETIPEEIDEQGEEIADSCIPAHRKKLRVRRKLGFHLNSARNAVQPTSSGRKDCLSSGRSGNAKNAATMAR